MNLKLKKQNTMPAPLTISVKQRFKKAEKKTTPSVASKSDRLGDGEQTLSVTSPSKSKRKKHFRRTAKEINRSFVCPYDFCQKIYGSEGSLNLHIKIKHNGGNKTDREKLAKTLVTAHLTGNF